MTSDVGTQEAVTIAFLQHGVSSLRLQTSTQGLQVLALGS
jgi:hypothetical protein